MAELLRFFPKQTLRGKSSGTVTYYSEIFDVSEFAELEVHYVHWAGDTITTRLQVTSDPTFSHWFPFNTKTVSGGTNNVLPYSGLLRFARIYADFGANEETTFQIEGVARRSS